ncbi:MAG: diguanylate cyclase [Acidobacteria bacterium]|nr:diguanylate cyclase [Acidobacteriota bacterium]
MLNVNLQSSMRWAGTLFAIPFYPAWQWGGVTLLLAGVLLIGIMCLLYIFHERRIAGVRRVEAEKSRRMSEIAGLHVRVAESLAIAINAKDQTSHGHVRRTQIYAAGLGKLAGVSTFEIEALRAGALLHDVGKLAVPEYILNKPGKLTTAEFEKMKIHANVGGDIIKRVNFPYPVEEAVRFHHEKWDGSGYPDGLKGEQIPLVARIISVVDFYDATRCDRPYRAGMKREASLALLRSMANTSFDPNLVEMFVENIDYFDSLIAEQDIQEQVTSGTHALLNAPRTSEELDSGIPSAFDEVSGFNSIAEVQREVFALHEISQTIGSSLNLMDTAMLVSSKLRAIVPFDTCVIYFVEDTSENARPAHVVGEHANDFVNHSIPIGEGITGRVIAHARSINNASPEIEPGEVPTEIAGKIRCVLASPLACEDGAFGAITLYSTTAPCYTTEHVRLLEFVALHASSALNNALMYEKTKERALSDPLTGLPNSHAFHMTLEQRVAESQRMNRESFALLSMDIDDFQRINDLYGHGIGDRLLASVAEVIKAQLRQMDVLARYAGDKFVAMMPAASADAAALAAERIRAAVESHEFGVKTGCVVQVSISIGVAAFPLDGQIADDLLAATERQMLRNKYARRLSPPASPSSPVVSIDAFR